MSVAVDASGNVYVSGNLWGVAKFGSTTLTSRGQSDAFVAKLDSAGNFQWAQRWGQENLDFGGGVSVDPDGNVLTAGFATENAPGGDYWFDGVEIYKFSPSGAVLWKKSLPHFRRTASRLATDRLGNVFVAGAFFGKADFDPDPSQAHEVVGGVGSGYLLKLNSAGDFVWVAPLAAPKMATSADVYTTDLQCDAEGNISWGGLYRGQIDFNPAEQIEHRLPDTDQYMGFTAKFSPAGSLLWVNSLGLKAPPSADLPAE